MHYIALEFDDNRILVATARLAAKRARIQSAFSIDVTGATDEQASERLKKGLAEHRVRSGDAIVVVKRSSVEIRELTLPPAPDDELPDMVRFMARSEFASLNDQWLLDFIPLSSNSSGPRKVLASGLSPDRLKQITRIAEAAGLKVKHILLRPLESYSLLLPELAPGKRSLIVDLGENQVDMIVISDRNVVATRTARISTESEAAQVASVLAEVKRTAVSAESSLNDRSIEEVIFLGDTPIDEKVAEGIRERMSVDVRIVKPFDLVDSDLKSKSVIDPAQYSALLGSLLQQSAGTRHAIDYLNPRRPMVKTDRQQKLKIYGGVAAGLVALVVGLGYWTLRSQKNEIARRTTQLSQLLERNKGNNERPGVDEILGEVRTIDEWKFADVNWLHELYEYSQRSLTPDDAIVNSFDASIRSGAPLLAIKGRVKSDGTAKLLASLEKRPFRIGVNRWPAEADDPSYPDPYDFSVSLSVDQNEVLKKIDEQASAEFDKQVKARLSGQNTEDEDSK
jgi:Tfp pilus assembly PilM family ATPase